MPSLVKKIVHGRPYYYAVWSGRVDGRPRIVRQVYLGRAEDVLAALEAKRPPEPARAQCLEFGACAALWQVAESLQLIALIDAHVPKRHQGLSAGQYLTLAALNRCIAPTSKRRFNAWYRSTILPRLLPASEASLSSQRFWDHMGRLDPDTIRRIETALAHKLVHEFGIDLRALIYDGTNFFTYIDTRNPARLPQRGHDKAKRNDLRTVSLGLLISLDFHVPLLHETYAGNVVDSVEFPSIVDELVRRYQALEAECESITLVFDKGNNSGANIEKLDDSPFHFVGSLVPTQHPDLLAISRRRFRPLSGERLAGVTAYRTRKVVFGAERTVVVTYNPRLYWGQKRGLLWHLKKRESRLAELHERLRQHREGRRRGKRPSLEAVQKQVEEILQAKHMREVLRVSLRSTARGLSLSYHRDRRALATLMHSLYGKTVLFTDQHDWRTEEIVLAYRGQYQVERCFRTMKDPHALCWWPRFHWTDDKIRVHAFYCVLALLLASLLQRQLAQKGIDHPIPRLLEHLRGIQEITLLYPPRGRSGRGKRPRRPHVVLSDLDKDQEQLFDALQLRRLQGL
jgi:transposase